MTAWLVSAIMSRMSGAWLYLAVGVAVLAAMGSVYVAGHRAGSHACELRHVVEREAQARQAEYMRQRWEAETTASEDRNAAAERQAVEDAKPVAAAIERGASAAECIDADSMRGLAGIGASDTVRKSTPAANAVPRTR